MGCLIMLECYFMEMEYLLIKKKQINTTKEQFKKNNLDAIYRYGKVFYNGDDEYPIDKHEASRIFKIAADAGHVKSMFKFGLMSLKGDGIHINKKNAIKYLNMASEKGCSDAKNALKK